jgi:putative sterol carrier protein
MSEIITEAVARLREKMPGGFDGIARFDIDDEGSILIDGSGVRAGAGEADVALAADADTFRAILEGDLDPTAAFMSGRLRIEGDMGAAMRLAATLG